jgi:hypothetical protein
MAFSIIANAKAKGSTKEAAKKAKPSVVMNEDYFIGLGHNKKDAKLLAAEFTTEIVELAGLNEEASNIKNKIDMIMANAKHRAKEYFLNMYTKTKKRPDNFEVFTANKEAVFQFIATDNYIKLGKEEAEALQEVYGEDIVQETTEFVFDNDLLNQYEKQISAAIAKMNVPDDVKENLIKGITTYKISKGTIDNLPQYGDVEEVYNAVQPIVQMKGVKTL